MAKSENKDVVEMHGCIVCARTFNVLAVYTPDGRLVDCAVTSFGGHCVPGERQPLVACDTHTAEEIETAHMPRAAWVSISSRSSSCMAADQDSGASYSHNLSEIGVKTMPQTLHVEHHFTGSELVRDIVIGMSDGLTVPFALAAGLSGIANSTSIVITGGLAEIAAGSIAMGLGGYLAARSDAEHYAAERATEQREVDTIPEVEVAEVEQVFLSYGLEKDQSALVANALRLRPAAWIDFMMRFELGLEKPDPKRALTSALTIGLSYIAGGLIPLAPYILIHTTRTALGFSVIFTLAALLIFGYVKGRFTGTRPFRSAIQTALIGGLAAAVAFGLAKLI
jgi:VIT1/CCC1 family predicted Fe2+/Mn2+ transporter